MPRWPGAHAVSGRSNGRSTRGRGASGQFQRGSPTPWVVTLAPAGGSGTHQRTVTHAEASPVGAQTARKTGCSPGGHVVSVDGSGVRSDLEACELWTTRPGRQPVDGARRPAPRGSPAGPPVARPPRGGCRPACRRRNGPGSPSPSCRRRRQIRARRRRLRGRGEFAAEGERVGRPRAAASATTQVGPRWHRHRKAGGPQPGDEEVALALQRRRQTGIPRRRRVRRPTATAG